MKTIKNLLAVIFAGVLLISCGKSNYRKTPGGMPYKLIKGKDTQQVKAGDFIKVQFTRKIKDSVHFTTEGGMAVYMQVNQVAQPYDISELWTKMRLGDSVVATQMIDTFIKREPQSVPPEFKKGDKITYYLKVVGIFPSDSAARADYENENKNWLAREVATIEKYLSEKKITAQKTPSGAFVEIINPGTGNVIDSGKYISANYTGTSWSGKKFDSNIDSTFGHLQPLSFVVGSTGPGSMIKGFDEGVRFLGLGGKAKVYIPSMLGYGASPSSPLIKPYENLIFDIEITDIKDKSPAPPKAQMQMQPPQPAQK